MIAALDVYYLNNKAKAVAVLFNWNDTTAAAVFSELITDVAPYEPGAFYKREFPCLLKVLKSIDLSSLEAIIVDGYVYPDDAAAPGLGYHLWNALDKKLL